MLDTLVADLTDVRLWLLVILLSAVGLAEKLAIYRAGQQSNVAVVTDGLGYKPERRAKVEEMFETKGSYILLLASIPGIGAVMAAVAGMVGVKTTAFVLWVAISNLTRNWLIVILTGQIVSLF